jgi:hypothetical protein
MFPGDNLLLIIEWFFTASYLAVAGFSNGRFDEFLRAFN